MMKVSVIIPAYNAEKWIGRCLDSLAVQTYEPLEIIVVNDGSKDSTMAILKSRAQKDGRIIVIDKPNSGTYQSRRVGLLRSTGDVILNADADDFLEPGAIERLVYKMKTSNADLVLGNSYKLIAGKKKLITNDIPDQQSRSALVRYLLLNDIKGYIWGRLYKKDLLLDLDYTPAGLLQEDTLVNLHILAFNNVKVAVEKVPVYNYVVHSESANSSRDPGFIENVYNFLHIAEGILGKAGLLQELSREFQLFKCRNWIVYARLGGRLSKDRNFRKEFYHINFSGYVKTRLPYYSYAEMLAYRYSSRAGRSLTKLMKTIDTVL